MKLAFTLLLLLTNLIRPTFACCGADNAWSINAAFGSAFYNNLPLENNQTNATGRLSLGFWLSTTDYFQLSLEGGIQNGNSMRLHFPKECIDVLGGIPIEVQLKPMLDLLLGLKTETFEAIPLFTWIKGGIVYQQLHIDRDSIPDLKKISPELMAGFGYKINEQASLHLGYQYIRGNTPQLIIYPETESAKLRHIPSRQAVLLGFSFNFL